MSDLDNVFHSLADPTRRAVLARLCEGSASVSDLAAPFDMALPSFTQHLKLLENCGLVTTRKVGRVRYCEVVPQRIAVAEDWMRERRQLWEQRLDRLEQHLAKLDADKGIDSSAETNSEKNAVSNNE